MLGMLALLALPVVVVLGTYVYFQTFGRIVPGVWVGETRLGGMTTYDAAVVLNKTWNLERKMIVGVLVDGDPRTWSLSPAQLGLSLNYLQTAQNAYAVGHYQDLITKADQMTASILQGWEIDPVVQFNQKAAQAGLQALSNQIGMPPQDAGIRLEGSNLIAVPGKSGYEIDIGDGLQKLIEDPQGVMANGYLTLVLKPVPPRINDVSAVLSEAQRLLDTRVVIKAYDPIADERFEWQVERETVATWLRIESSAQGAELGIDQDQVAEYLKTLSQDLDSGRDIDVEAYHEPLSQALRQGTSLTLKINYLPTTYIIKPGDTLIALSWEVGIPYWMILAANPGLNQDRLLAGQELVIPSKDDMLPLPVVENKRIVISIGEQRLWAYEDREQIAEHMISTGIDRSPTQPGVFQVQTHEINAYASVWDLNMPNFMGIYEAWPGFMNGIHGLPTLSSGRRLWAGVLGRPVSYGCIVMDLDAAEWLYDWAENGVVVEIKP